MTMPEALVVEFDASGGSDPVVVEITDDMEPQQIEMEKGDTIRFRENILTVPQAGIYKIHAHGVTQLALRERFGKR